MKRNIIPMRAVGIFLLLTLFLTGTFCQLLTPVHVLVNQQTTLFRNASGCENAEFRRVLPTKTTIATCQRHQCSIQLKKFTIEHDNLVLTSAKYTDCGTYECICNGITKYVKLDVVVALNVTAENSGNITLLCFAKHAKDVTWFHNDKQILHDNNRVSLNEDFEDGNLSLTLLNVDKNDAGLYFCRFNDETDDGYPYAHMLHVKDTNSSPGENQSDGFRTAFIIAFIVIIVLVLIIAGLIVLLYKMNSSQSTSTTASQPAENVPLTESQSTRTDAQPVQETLDPKSSSTQPF